MSEYDRGYEDGATSCGFLLAEVLGAFHEISDGCARTDVYTARTKAEILNIAERAIALIHRYAPKAEGA